MTDFSQKLSKLRRFFRPAVVAYVFLAAGVGYALNENSEIGSRTQRLAHDSAVARVHTVESRCKLTKILADGLPALSVKLTKSYDKCTAQLVEVKELAR